MMLSQAAKKALGLTSSQSTPWSVGIFRFYHENVIDHYDNPRNIGSFDKNDPSVGTGLVGAPACGDVMKALETKSLWSVVELSISILTISIVTVIILRVSCLWRMFLA